jgi:glycosyltransferase involved in cell wall biosynthesis
MASGTAVIGSAVGGIPEIISDQRTGILVPPDDTASLAKAISGLLADPEKKTIIEKAAREKAVADYSWDRLIRQLQETFGELT